MLEKTNNEEYLLLKLKIIVNRNLYEKEIIPYEIYEEMQEKILNKINKLI